MNQSVTLLWCRKDLRLTDNPALRAAINRGAVVPVFILDPETEAALGGAAKLRLQMAIEAFSAKLRAFDVPLILRRGDALTVLKDLIGETGADAVMWGRLTDGAALSRDKAVKAALKGEGLTAESFDGFTLLDPWRVKTGAGGAYKVYTPFWRAVCQMDIPRPLAPPSAIPTAGKPIASDALSSWNLSDAMGPAAQALATHIEAGEDAALNRLDDFLDRAGRYGDDRNALAKHGTSHLADHLALGEISPRTVWAKLEAHGNGGAAMRQIVWRDFAHHLLFHDPEMERLSWRREWSAFPWRGDNDDAEAWRRGETGVDVIDAAMRELWVTGRMHNRARMLVGSYLTKNLMTDWRVGEAHFRETLIDWDPANNAMGWQWVAGCGPDAAPFFRIFNPETQAEKFDPGAKYRQKWLGKTQFSQDFIAMRPKSTPVKPRHEVKQLVDLKRSRQAALDAWKNMREAAEITAPDEG
ncbi:MAG: cryptochrome/photolyase family protein [Pikeienuella sp.]